MKKILLLVVPLLLISACNLSTNCISKESFISGYENFSNDVQRHYKDLQDSDWSSIDKEFKEYVDICYPKFKKELSLEEKVDFWKSTLSYGIYRGDSDDSYQLDIATNLAAELDDLSLQGRQEIERYIKEEIKPDLKNAIDDVLNGVESIGEKIRDWLDEQ